MRSQLLSAGTNWLAFAATLAVSFFLTPYLIRTLGTARYDVWCSVEAVLAYFTLLDLGIAACLVRYVAKHQARADLPALNRMASTSLAVFLAAGLVALVLGLAVMGLLASRLIAKTGHAEDVLLFLVLMVVNLAATLPLSLFPAILEGLERYPERSAIRLLALAGRTAAIIWSTNHQPGLMMLGLILTASTVVENLLLALLCWRYLPGLRLSRRLIDRDSWQQVRTFSTDAFLAMLAGRITLQTGAIIAGMFLPVGAATIFVTASRLVEYAKTLLRNITTTLTPGISAREAKGDWDGIRRLFLVASRWVLYLVLPIQLGLCFFGWPFLARWVGPEIAIPSYPLVAILSLTLSIGVAQSVASRLLYGLGRLRIFARLALAEAALHLLCLVVLILPLALTGVAWSVVVPNLLFCGLVLAYTLRRLQLSWATYLGDAWSAPVVAQILPVVIWSLLPLPEPHWPAIFFAGALGLLPYILGVALWEFGHRLRWSSKRSASLAVLPAR